MENLKVSEGTGKIAERRKELLDLYDSVIGTIQEVFPEEDRGQLNELFGELDKMLAGYLLTSIDSTMRENNGEI